jgi:phosphate starvation-inducible PhoH-like protein
LAKKISRQQKQHQSSHAFARSPVVDSDFLPHVVRRKAVEPLQARTEAQGMYLAALQSSEIVFAIGPAGTGKTYVAAAWAAQQLMDKRIDKIVVTRPNVEAGEEMGHLPGELEEKFAPYLAPFREVMIERMGKGHYEYCLKAEYILPKPVGFMRGETFNDAVVIVDEAQNLTPEQMKMILTRIGQNCLMIIDGDPQQCDLNGPSGLMDAVHRLHDLKGIRVVEFTEDDIVRNGLIKGILRAYRR